MAVEEPADPALDTQINELTALYPALGRSDGALRLTRAELERHRARRALTELPDATRRPRGWLANHARRPPPRTDPGIRQAGRHFSELGGALLVQLAQMASAAVERTQLYRPIR